MALTKVKRLRLILDLLQDGDVTTEGDYAGLDIIPLPVAARWAMYVYDAHGPLYDSEGVARDFEDLATDEIAGFFLDQFIEFLRQVGYRGAVKAAAEECGAAAKATVDSDISSDFG